MIEWLILTSVKILKTALLTGISFVSSLATGVSDSPKAPCESVCVVAMRHRVPPIQVEMTFSPDLLRPPSRDLTL
jgi:hypothetical protein